MNSNLKQIVLSFDLPAQSSCITIQGHAGCGKTGLSKYFNTNFHMNTCTFKNNVHDVVTEKSSMETVEIYMITLEDVLHTGVLQILVSGWQHLSFKAFFVLIWLRIAKVYQYKKTTNISIYKYTCYHIKKLPQSKKKTRKKMFIDRDHHRTFGIMNAKHGFEKCKDNFEISDFETESHSCFYEEEDLHEKIFAPTQNYPPSQDDARREIFRLTTFKDFPQDLFANCSLLAQAGFFYTGVGDRVKCFSCSNETSAMTSSNPFDPEMHSYDCDCIAMRECGNISIISADEIQSEEVFENSASNRLHSRSSETHCPQRTVIADHAAASSSVSFEPNTRFVGQSHDTLLRRLNVKREADRMRTFDAWPSSLAKPSPRALSRSGFFFLGNSDRTQCFSCGGILKDWSSSYDVGASHLRLFPRCEMALGRDPDNIPDETFDATQMFDVGGNPFPLSAEDEVVLAQRYPCLYPITSQMVRLERRVRSFPQWNYTQASVRTIADAGFFYLGVGDRTKCFYCDGGLQGWHFHDDPWREHAKWFPSCHYLLRHKGHSYVDDIVSRYPGLNRPVMKIRGGDAPTSSQINLPPHNNPVRNHSNDVSSRKRFHHEASSSASTLLNLESRTPVQNNASVLEEAMGSDIAKAVIEMGFERETVREANRLRIEGGNGPYDSAYSLLEAALALDQTKQQNVSTSELSPNETTKPAAIEATNGMPSESLNNEAAALVSSNGSEKNLEVQLQQILDERLCKVCLDEDAVMLFVPCNHLCCCIQCTQSLRRCPICRANIVKAIRTYIS